MSEQQGDMLQAAPELAGDQGYLSDHVAEQYDFSFLASPERLVRLQGALGMLRNIVTIPFPGLVEVKWAERTELGEGVQGVMIHTHPKQILLNPEAVLEHAEGPVQALVDALHGVALHEAAHAAWTPRTWAIHLERLLREHQQRTGYALPRSLVIAVGNWVEDFFVEGRLARDYPGFDQYFQNVRAFFLPDAACREALARAEGAWLPSRQRTEADRLAAAEAVGPLLSVLVHRPQCIDTVPEPLMPLAEAAQAIRAAGRHSRVTARVQQAVEVADQVFRWVMASNLSPRRRSPRSGTPPSAWVSKDAAAAGTDRDKTAPSAVSSSTEETADGDRSGKREEPSGPVSASSGASKGEGKSPEAGGPSGEKPLSTAEETSLPPRLIRRIATSINRSLEDRESILRDTGNPVGVERCGGSLSPDEAAALAEAIHSTSPVGATSTGGAVPSKALSARMVESSPETLWRYRQVERVLGTELAQVAGALLREHRPLAEELRRRLRFRDTRLELRQYSQTSGDLDEGRLAVARAAQGRVFFRREVAGAGAVDLTLLIDESGSMGTNNHWCLATAAAVCIEYAVRNLKSVRFRVFGFTSDCFDRGETIVYRHYDSAVPRLRRPQALGGCFPKANNADGMALGLVRQMIRRDRRPEAMPCLLMISDGQPNSHQYQGEAARRHVRQQVQALLRDGVGFAHLQMGTGCTDEHLSAMYGRRWQRVQQADEIPSGVAELALRWLDPSLSNSR